MLIIHKHGFMGTRRIEMGHWALFAAYGPLVIVGVFEVGIMHSLNVLPNTREVIQKQEYNTGL